MSKVIQVLEQMSCDADCQSENAINNLLVATELDTEITEAIVNKDVISLERQLDVRPDIVCFIGTPEDEDDEDGEDEDTTETKDSNVVGF